MLVLETVMLEKEIKKSFKKRKRKKPVPAKKNTVASSNGR